MKILFVAALAIVLTVTFIVPANAEISKSIAVQGVLKTSAGAPITTATNVNFSIYNVETGGTPLVSIVQNVNTTPEGIFTALLDLSSLKFDADYWIGIRIGTETLTPRQRLTPAPYALALPNLVSVGGQIGIGTATPLATLHVSGKKIPNQASANAELRLQTIIDGTYARIWLLPNLNSTTENTSVKWSIGARRDLAGLMDYLVIDNNGLNGGNTMYRHLVISPSGNVGIGAPAPNVKLHISGGADANISSGSGYLVIGNVNGENMVMDSNEIMARNNGTKSGLVLNAEGGNVRIGKYGVGTTILDTGTVGVGVQNPSSGVKMEVNGTVKATKFIGDGSELTGIAAGSSDSGAWTKTGSNVVLATTDDNVGIGTTPATGAKLDVNGPIRGNNGLTITGGSVGIGVAVPTEKLTVNGTFSANSTLYVLNSGRVGIGTAYPTQQFEIVDSLGGNISLKSMDTNIIAGSVLGRIYFKGKDQGTKNNLYGAVITAIADGTWDGLEEVDAPTRLEFYTQTNGNTNGFASPRMVISSAGEVKINSISNDGNGKVVCIKSDGSGNLGTCTLGISSAQVTCYCE